MGKAENSEDFCFVRFMPVVPGKTGKYIADF
jgi:hypothetical protein